MYNYIKNQWILHDIKTKLTHTIELESGPIEHNIMITFDADGSNQVSKEGR